MAIKYMFYVGLNDKDTHVQTVSTLNAATIIQNIFASYSCGVTITEGKGVYVHENGDIVTENTLIVSVYEFDGEPEKPIGAICADLKKILNQESIAVERQETNSMLY